MEAREDRRNVSLGRQIPTETYSDQPYVVKTDDGAWLCAVTTGVGREGDHGQHVSTRRSTDRGLSWEEPVDVEPADGPEASYAVLLKAPGGRIYCFYNHNTDDVRAVKADDPPYPGGLCRRVDSLGHFVFKLSDDHGRSWSRERFDIPVREMDIDRKNPYGGSLRFFWNVGKPFFARGTAYVPLHKVGGFGEGFFTRSEGVLLASANLAAESDPRRIRWETLPDGDFGLRTPAGGGPIAEEQSTVVLSDGSFFCVYRTIDGHPACAYSRDGGHTWSEPRYLGFADGRRMKHPRAASFVWRCGNGKYLYWFHNHGGRFLREHPRRRSICYDDRNPVWLCGGIEAEAPEGRVLLWSQPEIVLYDDDPRIRMSYPDLVEEDGRTYLTETQKNTARVHEVDPSLLAGLWGQLDGSLGPVGRDDLLLELTSPIPQEVAAPPLPALCARDPKRADFGTLNLRGGITVELSVRLGAIGPGQELLANTRPDGRGLSLRTAAPLAVELGLHDGQTEHRWASDPGLLSRGRRHHIVAILDAGPRTILFVVDGRLCDGGEHRQFGWGRVSPFLNDLNGEPRLRLDPGVEAVRIYGRALRVSEAVAAARAGA